MTPYTALLVLETEQDYARFHIDRKSLTDVLAVQDGAVKRVHRTSIAFPKGLHAHPRRAGAATATKSRRRRRGLHDARREAERQGRSHEERGRRSEDATIRVRPGPVRMMLDAPKAVAAAAPRSRCRCDGVARPTHARPRASAGAASAAPRRARGRARRVGGGGLRTRRFAKRRATIWGGPAAGRARRAAASGRAPSLVAAAVGRAPPSAALPAMPDDIRSAKPPYEGKLADVMEKLAKANGQDDGARDRACLAEGEPGRRARARRAGRSRRGEGRSSSSPRVPTARSSISSRIAPTCVASPVSASSASRTRRRPPLAIDTFRKAVADRPDHPSSHRLLAFALLRDKQYEKAFEAALVGVAPCLRGRSLPRRRPHPPRGPRSHRRGLGPRAAGAQGGDPRSRSTGGRSHRRRAVAPLRPRLADRRQRRRLPHPRCERRPRVLQQPAPRERR